MNPSYTIPPLLSLVSFLGLAVLTMRRGLRTRVHRLFAGICILGVFLYADILAAFHLSSASTAFWISRIDHVFLVYLPALYLHFFHEYLDIRPAFPLVPAAYAFSLILMAFVPTPLYLSGMHRHAFGWYAQGGPLYPLFGAAALAATLYAVLLLMTALRAESSGVTRRRLWLVLTGFASMGLLNACNVLPSLGLSIYPPGCFSFLPLSILYVGFFRYDLLDMGVLLRKGLTYASLTAALSVGYALVVAVAGSVFFTFRPAVGDPATIAIFFLLVALVFVPMKDRIQETIDRMLDRKRARYRRILHRASRKIAAMRDLNQIEKLLTESVSAALQPVFCRLVLSDGAAPAANREPGTAGSPMPAGDDSLRRCDPATLMERWRRGLPPLLRRGGLDAGGQRSDSDFLRAMRGLEVEAVLPLAVDRGLHGLFLMGEKRSGVPYTPEDLEMLETLVNQAAVAVEHSRVHHELAQLTEELEHRVAERTRELEMALLEKEKSQRRLVQSERLAAIGQLVAGTAHELNNPLAASLSLTQSVREELEEAPLAGRRIEAIAEDLLIISEQLKRAKNIVSSLLGLSRQNQEYTEAVDLTAVVRDALRILQNEIRQRGIRVVEVFDPALPEMEGNFAQVGQVVLNLIRNAIQASRPKSGKMVLSTIFDRCAREVVFSCRDFGCGVPDAIRSDIFAPFFTTKPAGEGTGLGLYISLELARKHGGSLELASVDGEGAEFVLRLPTAGGMDDKAAEDGPETALLTKFGGND
ncbi:MAG: hypothetical protein LJE65_03185 [Desulfobacteraceae bacterium]|nr:hypothetical protein [Desulfobacteraceae bacterium]